MSISRDIDLTEKLDFNKDRKLLPMVSSGRDLLLDKISKKKRKEALNQFTNTYYFNNTSISTSNTTTTNIYSGGMTNTYRTSYNYGGTTYSYNSYVVVHDNSTYYNTDFGTYNYGGNSLSTTQSTTSTSTTENYYTTNDSGTIMHYFFNTKVGPKTNEEKIKEIFSRSKDYTVPFRTVNLRSHDKSMKSSETFTRKFKFKSRLNSIYYDMMGGRFEPEIPWDHKEIKDREYERKIPWLRRLSSWNYKDYMEELKGNDVNYMSYLDSNWYNPRHSRIDSRLNITEV